MSNTAENTLWTLSDFQKEIDRLWDSYKSTRKGIRERDFRLGAEAALINNIEIVGEWTSEYTGPKAETEYQQHVNQQP